MATLEETTAAMEADHSLRRRDFINIAAVSFAGVGVVAVAIPLVNQMSPSADVLALASTEVDISKIAPGQAIKTIWRKQPVFVRNLTPQEIAAANKVPLGAGEGESRGAYGGYFCPCHGSSYDTAARIRKGPAPLNLHVPDYAFTSDTVVTIG